LCYNFKPCGPSAFDFRPANATSGYGNSLIANSDVLFNSGTGLIVPSGVDSLMMN